MENLAPPDFTLKVLESLDESVVESSQTFTFGGRTGIRVSDSESDIDSDVESVDEPVDESTVEYNEKEQLEEKMLTYDEYIKLFKFVKV